MSKKIKIDSKTYNSNLEFYTMLKLLIQCQLSDKQLIYIQETVDKNKKNIVADVGLLKILLVDTNAVVKENTEKNASLNYFLNTVETMGITMWCDFIDSCIDLLLVKDLILQESKLYAANEYRKELKNIKDLLSIEYDMSNIHLPYGQRVISSLLVFAFTDIKRTSEFVLENSEKSLKSFSKKLKYLMCKYHLNINNMFHIIMDESMNQSIKSDAGSSFESRVANSLSPIVEKLYGHSHDSKIPSVEYDNTFIFNGKLCGVSAKRTLRERYKQNLEDVSLLDVDYMFVITLGTDLNEDKLNNILLKEGVYVIVSQEEYESRLFLNTNLRVISSDNIKNSFISIIK